MRSWPLEAFKDKFIQPKKITWGDIDTLNYKNQGKKVGCLALNFLLEYHCEIEAVLEKTSAC